MITKMTPPGFEPWSLHNRRAVKPQLETMGSVLPLHDEVENCCYASIVSTHWKNNIYIYIYIYIFVKRIIFEERAWVLLWLYYDYIWNLGNILIMIPDNSLLTMISDVSERDSAHVMCAACCALCAARCALRSARCALRATCWPLRTARCSLRAMRCALCDVCSALCAVCYVLRARLGIIRCLHPFDLFWIILTYCRFWKGLRTHSITKCKWDFKSFWLISDLGGSVTSHHHEILIKRLVCVCGKSVDGLLCGAETHKFPKEGLKPSFWNLGF